MFLRRAGGISLLQKFMCRVYPRLAALLLAVIGAGVVE